ncbi:hypothetical protein EV424DRAFT_1387579 [Suillus variegatus]|nr:hypothetical protein EV424DRAFT_1387579 [Suillus variegatus]
MAHRQEPPPIQENDPSEIDPIWTSSRTARQIYALGEVEKDITRLLSLAASSVSLLTLPQTDEPDDNLPQGEERSEQFVLEVSEYFERLDSIQVAIRSSLAHIRQATGTRGLQEERTDRDAWVGILDALTRLKASQQHEQLPVHTSPHHAMNT